jgi:pimeloyl-ACP methyl ester carboxylesterase
VYLHAAGGITEGDPMLAALAERHDVFAPVHPGFDDLAELDDIRDVHDLALYYDDLLEALGLDAVAVVGHSFGGMIAAELAAHVPKRVARLVLISPFGLWRDDLPVADLFVAFPTEVHELLWADPSAHREALSPPSGETLPPEQLAALLGLLQGLTAAGKFLWPIPDKGLRRRLHRISAPTLLIWGDHDRLVPPAYASDFAAAIPRARAEVVAGAGHMVPVEKQDEVVGLIESFLAPP